MVQCNNNNVRVITQSNDPMYKYMKKQKQNICKVNMFVPILLRFSE